MLKVVPDEADRESVSVLDELVAEGARRMLAAALEAEVTDYIDRHVDEVDEAGKGDPPPGSASGTRRPGYDDQVVAARY